MGKAGKIIICVLGILVIAGIMAFILKLTNGGTDEFKFFYITDESGKVYATKDSVKLRSETETQFNVNYTLTNENMGYTVKVVPVITDETEFEYTVDGETVKYSAELDLTPAFNIKTYDEYFTIIVPDEMRTILTAVHAGKTVEVPEGIDLLNTSYFSLVVTSYNGNDETVIQMKHAVVAAEDIELTPGNIVIIH